MAWPKDIRLAWFKSASPSDAHCIHPIECVEQRRSNFNFELLHNLNEWFNCMMSLDVS